MRLYSQAVYAINPLPYLETENVEKENVVSISFAKLSLLVHLLLHHICSLVLH